MKTLAALLIALMIWGLGLLAFTGRVDQSTPAPEPPISDGVVVLTGASNLRLEAATRLLEDGKGKRLLISGVNREATRADVQSVTRAVKPIYDCCVDLGFSAADLILKSLGLQGFQEAAQRAQLDGLLVLWHPAR